MTLSYKHLLWLTIFAFLGLRGKAQPDTIALDPDTTYTLVGNSLLTNKGFKISLGQPIIIGKGAGQNGWYRTITFKNPTASPIMLFRNQELSQNGIYHNDESTRANDKVNEALAEGDTLIVTKIKRYGPRRSGKTWYVVFLRKEQGLLSLNFRCYVEKAIHLGEVRLQD